MEKRSHAEKKSRAKGRGESGKHGDCVCVSVCMVGRQAFSYGTKWAGKCLAVATPEQSGSSSSSSSMGRPRGHQALQHHRGQKLGAVRVDAAGGGWAKGYSEGRRVTGGACGWQNVMGSHPCTGSTLVADCRAISSLISGAAVEFATRETNNSSRGRGIGNGVAGMVWPLIAWFSQVSECE